MALLVAIKGREEVITHLTHGRTVTRNGRSDRKKRTVETCEARKLNSVKKEYKGVTLKSSFQRADSPTVC